MTTISACLIVRDSDTVLERCLDSLTGAYDELCIVDTGSTDRTADIAYRRADRFDSIVSCNDCSGRINDFAAARNHCANLASGTWILMIDSDEVFSNRSERSVRELVESTTATAVAVTLARGETEWLAHRLFRNLPTQRYRHRVHETISVAGEVHTFRQLVFRDLGQPNKTEQSASRNVRICEAILRENPDDLRAIFYRAEALRKLGRYVEAGQSYLDCIDDDRFGGPYRCAAFESLALCFTHLRRWNEALGAAREVVRLHPGLAEGYCIMGDAYLALRDIPRAELCYKQAARQTYPPEDFSLFVRRSSYEQYPQYQLRCLRVLRDQEGGP